MAGTVGSWAIDDTEEIGSGGFGSVLKARHLQSGEVAAAKHIIHEHMRLAAIQHEAGLMKRCEHPHVVRLYEYLQLEKESYLFMELAEGGELFSRVLDDGNLDEGVARSYFAQLMDAVDYLHGQGIAHRDLKLENVLLSSSNECKICDFGLAHLYKDLKREPLYEVCGSKSYAAPEILASRGYDGYSVDVWSCGICLFAMLAGFFPLDGATESDWRFVRVCQAVMQGESLTRTIFGFYERPCVLSNEAAALFDAMLSLQPSTRLSVPAVLSSAWLIGSEKAASLAAKQPMPAQMITSHEQLQQALAGGCYADGPRYRGDMRMPVDFGAYAPEGGVSPTYRGMPNMSAEVFLHQAKGGLEPPGLERQHAFRGVPRQH